MQSLVGGTLGALTLYEDPATAYQTIKAQVGPTYGSYSLPCCCVEQARRFEFTLYATASWSLMLQPKLGEVRRCVLCTTR